MASDTQTLKEFEDCFLTLSYILFETNTSANEYLKNISDEKDKNENEKCQKEQLIENCELSLSYLKMIKKNIKNILSLCNKENEYNDLKEVLNDKEKDCSPFITPIQLFDFKKEQEKQESNQLTLVNDTILIEKEIINTLPSITKDLPKGKLLIEDILTNEEIKQIEEWTQLKVSSILFNSNIDNYEYGMSSFDSILRGVPMFIIVIIDTKGNKFGGYFKTSLWDRRSYTRDNEAFLFSLGSCGRIDGMVKFPIIDPDKCLFMRTSANELLFRVGQNGNDLTVYKKDCGTSTCHQCSFAYGNHRNALCGSNTFEIKYLFAIKLN